MTLDFFVYIIALGLGLSMDTCVVSMANGLNNPKLKFRQIFLIAIPFAILQGLMPLIGYFLGYAILGIIETYLPILSFIILCLLGINMIKNGIIYNNSNNEILSQKIIWGQALATSIDALSVGFTFASLTIPQAIISTIIISIITFTLSILGFIIGKKFGDKFGKYTKILGGIILIIIGLKIILENIL